jgi:hypothetical protein
MDAEELLAAIALTRTPVGADASAGDRFSEEAWRDLGMWWPGC